MQIPVFHCLIRKLADVVISRSCNRFLPLGENLAGNASRELASSVARFHSHFSVVNLGTMFIV